MGVCAGIGDVVNNVDKLKLFFISVMGVISFLLTNFFITLYRYYYQFKTKPDQEQKLINKFTFVCWNAFIITFVYLFTFYLVSFIYLTFKGQDIKILLNPILFVILLFTGGFISSTSIFIATALLIFDSIIAKQINPKYTASMAFILVLLTFYPLFKAIWEALNYKSKKIE